MNTTMPSHAPLGHPRSLTDTPVPKATAELAEVSLRYHSMVQPPLVRISDDERTRRLMGVWTQDAGAPSDSLVTHRRLTLQSLQLKLDLLGGHYCKEWNPVLRQLVDDQLDHLYLGSSAFARMRTTARNVRGEPATRPAFVDPTAAWLVIDANRFFVAGQPELTAPAYEALCAIAEAPDFVKHLHRHLQRRLSPEHLSITVQELRATLRALLCHALGQRETPILPSTRHLIRTVGWASLSRAVLAGSLSDIEGLADAFLRQPQD